MDVNYRFMVEHIRTRAPTGKVLDYGCGAGGVVEAARAAGVDAYGVEAFYAGGDARDRIVAKGLLDVCVFALEDGRIPFPDATFDLIVSNQVLEHVQDLDLAVAEMVRVLKPGGSMLHSFPSREVLYEAHIGIPFAHRLPRGVRYAWSYALRRLGLGTYKGDLSPSAWTRRGLDWIDQFTVYRTRRELDRIFRRHGVSYAHRELEYIHFRLGDGAPARLAAALRPVSEAIFRRLAFMVLDARTTPTVRPGYSLAGPDR